MKTELTPQEQELTNVVREEWLSLAFDKNAEGIDKELFEKGIEWLYHRFLDLPKPQVIYCDGLIEAVLKITLVKDFGKDIEDYTPDMVEQYGNKSLPADFMEKFKENYNLKSTYCGWSNFGWVSFYDYFTRIGVINHEDFNQYKDIIRSNVFETFEFENAVFAVQPPAEINRNENGQLHSTSGHALAFKDGSKFYYINGREIDRALIEGEITKERFLTEENEDIRGAIFEIVESKGEGSMMDLLEAYEYGTETIEHRNGEQEVLTLYRTKETFAELQDINGKTDVPLCWLRLVCPSTGQNYLISTDSSFKTPTEAAKYHRPEEVPFELGYSWLSRN
jgi:hypothetical protein